MVMTTARACGSRSPLEEGVRADYLSEGRGDRDMSAASQCAEVSVAWLRQGSVSGGGWRAGEAVRGLGLSWRRNRSPQQPVRAECPESSGRASNRRAEAHLDVKMNTADPLRTAGRHHIAFDCLPLCSNDSNWVQVGG